MKIIKIATKKQKTPKQAHRWSAQFVSMYSTFAPRLCRTAVKNRRGTVSEVRNAQLRNYTPRSRRPAESRKPGAKTSADLENRRLTSPPIGRFFQYTLLHLSLWRGERKAEKNTVHIPKTNARRFPPTGAGWVKRRGRLGGRPPRRPPRRPPPKHRKPKETHFTPACFR